CIVCGVVLSPQTSVPVWEVAYLYTPLYVTVVVAPLAMVGVTWFPSSHKLIDPSTTVVEPSTNTILTGEFVSAPVKPLDGKTDFTYALPAAVRNAFGAFGSFWLMRYFCPVPRSTINHSRFAPPVPFHHSNRNGKKPSAVTTKSKNVS